MYLIFCYFRPAGSYPSGCCINFNQHVNVIIKLTLQVRQNSPDGLPEFM